MKKFYKIKIKLSVFVSVNLVTKIKAEERIREKETNRDLIETNFVTRWPHARVLYVCATSTLALLIIEEKIECICKRIVHTCGS